jgi:hypothetical protein
VAVRPDEDGVVARCAALGHPARDVPSDPVGLFGAGGERFEADRRARLAALRTQALGDPGPHLQAIGIVETHESI